MGALHQLTTSLAAHLAPKNITANTIDPGATDTGYADEQQRQDVIGHESAERGIVGYSLTSRPAGPFYLALDYEDLAGKQHQWWLPRGQGRSVAFGRSLIHLFSRAARRNDRGMPRASRRPAPRRPIGAEGFDVSLPLREGVRVLMLDEHDRLLMIKVQDASIVIPEEPVPDIFWTTVGGGLANGESYEQAAQREVFEETGIDEFCLGPWIWDRERTVNWRGEPRSASVAFHRS
jgi:NUDIX domain/Enoyl-(Acyl carrier protein) reductase